MGTETAGVAVPPLAARERLARAKALRVRQNNQNSQNEPGMSAGINEIENRGRESRLANGRLGLLGDRRMAARERLGAGEGAEGETE